MPEEFQPMTIVHAEMVGDKMLVSREELEHLVDLAKRSEPVDLQIVSGEISTPDLMRLAEKGGSFDFWADPAEDIYSATDGEPI
jgi:hypothetical protein